MKAMIDTKDLRKALGQFPTGVTVITTLDSEAGIIGVTASSFNTVSMDPPLVLWSVTKTAYSAEIFKKAEHFIVNILGKDQIDISNTCARQGEDKFANIEYEAGVDNCPIIKDSAAFLECKTWNVYDVGDHHIIVGEVINYKYNDKISPLVFAQGRYAATEPIV